MVHISQQQVTLTDLLEAKERRKARQDDMLRRFPATLVSITINMPGPVKDGMAVRRLCDYAVQQIRAGLSIVAEERIYPATGPEALLAVSEPPDKVKATAVAIEEATPFGRLLDIDVFAAGGRQHSRADEGLKRSCLICSQPAVLCMRERRHGPAELEQAVNRLINRFHADCTRTLSPEAESLGALAVEAMLYEVACTPAPGLVDRANSGAHSDMDFYTFMASSAALSVTMARLAQAGIAHNGPLADLLPVLRYIGLEGEEAMHAATNGVNTHKGLLFSLGIVAGAAGWITARQERLSPETVLAAVAAVTAGIGEELARSVHKDDRQLTAGERLYRRYGITGIRGQMEAGLPAVGQQALPALRQALAGGLGINAALVHTLMVLMTCVDDTTVMNRHNPDKMRIWVKAKAAAALAAGGMYTEAGRSLITALDQEFIRHNVSPGGSADLLAVTWFIHRLTSKG